MCIPVDVLEEAIIQTTSFFIATSLGIYSGILIINLLYKWITRPHQK